MSPSAPSYPSYEDLLLRTSRTFALTIPLLPQPTRHEVGLAYLLFRIADTLEDATCWPAAKQCAELGRFGALLAEPDLEQARRLAADWKSDPPLDHEGYLELLDATPHVIDGLIALQQPALQSIAHHTRRTSERMAAFVERRGEGHLQLDDIPDLQAYCYAVAGIVGEMLTELFLIGRPELEPIAGALRERAATFGEALQLVNILKDCATDAEEGRRFLPADVERGEVFALARHDLAVASDYIDTLQQANAPRGLVEFTALPVLLAAATLDRVERDGPGAKISRVEVQQIVQQMHEDLDAGRRAVPPLRQTD